MNEICIETVSDSRHGRASCRWCNQPGCKRDFWPGTCSGWWCQPACKRMLGGSVHVNNLKSNAWLHLQATWWWCCCCSCMRNCHKVTRAVIAAPLQQIMVLLSPLNLKINMFVYLCTHVGCATLEAQNQQQQQKKLYRMNGKKKWRKWVCNNNCVARDCSSGCMQNVLIMSWY